MSGSWKMAMADCFYVKLGRDILWNGVTMQGKDGVERDPT